MHLAPVTPAFILHTRPYRETSMLVDFFTQEYGRISAVVRGVRQVRSKRAGLLLPFLPLCVSFRGKTDLVNIITLESTGVYFSLQNRALFCGLYANELLCRLLHKYDPYPVLYSLYQEFLTRLHKLPANITQQQWVLYLFAQKLLQEIGYGVQWHKTANGEPINPDEYYYFEFGIGFVVARQQQGILARNKYKGTSLLALYEDNWIDSNDSQSKNILQEIDSIFSIIFQRLLGEKFLLCQRVFGGTVSK